MAREEKKINFLKKTTKIVIRALIRAVQGMHNVKRWFSLLQIFQSQAKIIKFFGIIKNNDGNYRTAICYYSSLSEMLLILFRIRIGLAISSFLLNARSIFLKTYFFIWIWSSSRRTLRKNKIFFFW